MSVFENQEFVYTYTRAQAIADGVLIDVTKTAQEAGFRYPVAITAAAWGDCVAWSEHEKAYQDESGRLWDVLWMARDAARRAQGSGSLLRFTVYRIPRGARKAQPCTLALHCGPGDHGEPVLTVMLPGED